MLFYMLMTTNHNTGTVKCNLHVILFCKHIMIVFVCFYIIINMLKVFFISIYLNKYLSTVTKHLQFLYTVLNGRETRKYSSLLNMNYVPSHRRLSRGKQPPYCPGRPRGYKTFFMLNSVEHEILNAHKYKTRSKFSILGSDELIMSFFLFINVLMPTIVGILTLMSRKKA